DGGGGSDAIDGGAGADHFLLTSVPAAGAGTSRIFNFTSGVDELRFDGRAFTQIGPSGDFAAGDGRFYAAAGASAGHDADDRLIYDTSTGRLWYDADGSGAGVAQLVATLQEAPNLAATDIDVAAGKSGGMTFTGTAGNDTLT